LTTNKFTTQLVEAPIDLLDLHVHDWELPCGAVQVIQLQAELAAEKEKRVEKGQASTNKDVA